MQIISIDKDRCIKIEGDKADVLSLTAVKDDLKTAEDRLAELPKPLTDEELLAWARENYPQMNYAKEKETLEAKIIEYKSILEAINGD